MHSRNLAYTERKCESSVLQFLAPQSYFEWPIIISLLFPSNILMLSFYYIPHCSHFESVPKAPSELEEQMFLQKMHDQTMTSVLLLYSLHPPPPSDHTSLFCFRGDTRRLRGHIGNGYDHLHRDETDSYSHHPSRLESGLPESVVHCLCLSWPLDVRWSLQLNSDCQDERARPCIIAIQVETLLESIWLCICQSSNNNLWFGNVQSG